MHHNELECHAKKPVILLFSRSRSQQGLVWSKYESFVLYLLNCWSFCYKTLFDSTLSSARVSYEEIGLLCSGSRSRQNFKMSMTVYPDAVFWNAEPYTTKLGTLMHHHEPNSLSKILVCCLQGQGHSEGLYYQNITLTTISSELLILWQPNLVRW